ncbi:hypothetical protein RB195_015976 [Necator americanus]
MTTAEVMELLRDERDIYESIEQNLRRMMLEEKPDAALPVLSRNTEDLSFSGSSQYMPSYMEDFIMGSGTHLNDGMNDKEDSKVDEVAG